METLFFKGNCIDKISRQLGLFETSRYDCSSGGALMEKCALNGDTASFPGLINMTYNYCRKNKNCNFSYSGLLASTHRLIDKLIEQDFQLIEINGEKKRFLNEKSMSDICASVQSAISLQLEDRLRRSLIYLEYRNIKVKNLVVSGGVASNLYIRSSIQNLCHKFNVRLSCPPVKYCTDNGVMIAWNGCEKLIHKSKDIVYPKEQNDKFFKNLTPLGKAEFGIDISQKINKLNIKI